MRDGRIKRVGLQARPVRGKTPDEVDVALPRLVQFGIFTQTLVVDGQGHDLGLLELEPVDGHLKEGTCNISVSTEQGVDRHPISPSEIK